MKPSPPKIDSDFVCIINRDDANLAALIVSHIDQSAGYIPVFEFPFVSAKDFEVEPKEEIRDEHQLSRTRARKFNIRVGNAIARIGGCKYLIVAGLNDNQKSYLTFLDKCETIFVEDAFDVESMLGALVEKEGSISCSETNLIDCLPYALKNNLSLKIENSSVDIPKNRGNNEGLVVVEKNEKVSSVFGILYGHSIGSDIELIETKGINHYEIKDLIEQWKVGKAEAYNDLSAVIYPGIEHIHFAKRKFVTFFTDGLPYSLILKNIVPISHVHLRINPDFFVFNNINLASHSDTFSAVVFSPEKFEDEETDFVVDELTRNNFLVKSLIGNDATYFNLDNHIQHYPYGLLHLCSHGGEIKGNRIIEKFLDSNGEEHTVEYDEIFSYGLNPYKDSHKVATKRMPRKFDGLTWGSREFKESSYGQSVFADMFRLLGNEKNQESSIEVNVPGSCHIQCADSVYQAMFSHLAAMQSPLIFNNTCWSWSDIADSFLGAGAMGYIGTLWNIDNSRATKSAKIFYENIFDNSILFALHKALGHLEATRDENIYIFWGLHFKAFTPSPNLKGSRLLVFNKIMDSMEMWKSKLEKTQNTSHKKTISETIDWVARILIQDFKAEVLKYVIKK
ncbi:MAG: hypothetical protein AAF600_01695 [Bacteroidota bacterium]